MAIYYPPVLDLIDHHPLQDALSPCRAAFEFICRKKNISCSIYSLHLLDRAELGKVIVQIALVLHDHPLASLIPSADGRKTFQDDLRRVISSLASQDSDIERLKRLLRAALHRDVIGRDGLIWSMACEGVSGKTARPTSPQTSTQITGGALPTSSSQEDRSDDPTVVRSSDGDFIDIKRDGQTERLVLVQVLHRSRCISSGRGTTCWKAHLDSDPQTTLVIKDTWQDSTRDEEGELLREATAKGVANISRYYHHETVCGGRVMDDVRGNVQEGLEDMTSSSTFDESVSGSSRQEQSARAGSKRGSSQIGAALLPSSKRIRSSTSSDSTGSKIPSNRVHRRVVLMDYGRPIYKAYSIPELLYALEGCITGHESVLQAGFLHRDISINNLLIQQDDPNDFPKGLLIDLDMAVRIGREDASGGAPGKTGTRAFMAIGALLGDQHSFMHDLESFFWVLFWICVHSGGPGKGVRATTYDRWNHEDERYVVAFKRDIIAEEDRFFSIAEHDFTPYYRPLALWVNRLRQAIFPQGRPWSIEDGDLYSKMRAILQQARQSYDLVTSLG